MRLTLVIFLLCSFLTNINAQPQKTGSIKLYLSSDVEGPDSCILYMNDSTIGSTNVLRGNIFKNLTPGIYKIDFFKGTSDVAVLIVSDIEVFADSITFVDVDYSSRQYHFAQTDTTNDYFYPRDYSLGLLYGLIDDKNQGLIKDEFKVNITTSFLPYSRRNLALGFIFGIGNFNYSRFEKDSSVFMPADHKRENYSYLYFPLGIITRFSLNDMAKTPNNRIILDLGATYNFPVWFRHSFKDNNSTTLTKRIQKYNDISAFCGIGFTPFTIRAEYRLTDFLKDGFPEMPRLYVGIIFVIFS